jgi:hypothetical protein
VNLSLYADQLLGKANTNTNTHTHTHTNTHTHTHTHKLIEIHNVDSLALATDSSIVSDLYATVINSSGQQVPVRGPGTALYVLIK